MIFIWITMDIFDYFISRYCVHVVAPRCDICISHEYGCCLIAGVALQAVACGAVALSSCVEFCCVSAVTFFEEKLTSTECSSAVSSKLKVRTLQ